MNKLYVAGRLTRVGKDGGPYYHSIVLEVTELSFSMAEEQVRLFNIGLSLANLRFYPETISNRNDVFPYELARFDLTYGNTLMWSAKDSATREGIIKFIEESKASDRPA